MGDWRRVGCTRGPVGGRPVIYGFGDHEIDLAVHEVRRRGAVVPVEPQVFDVLVHLVANRDRTVTKDELLDAVWGDRFVSESALTSRIKAARRVVGDDGDRQRVIKTVHGRGYRWVAGVTEHDGGSSGAAGAVRARRGGPLEQRIRMSASLASAASRTAVTSSSCTVTRRAGSSTSSPSRTRR